MKENIKFYIKWWENITGETVGENGNPTILVLSFLFNVQLIAVHCDKMEYFQVTLYLGIESYFTFLPLEFLLYFKFQLKWYDMLKTKTASLGFAKWNTW